MANELLFQTSAGHVTSRTFATGSRELLTVYTGVVIDADDGDAETGYRAIKAAVKLAVARKPRLLVVDVSGLLVTPGFESTLRHAYGPLRATGTVITFKGTATAIPKMPSPMPPAAAQSPSIAKRITALGHALKAAKAVVYHGVFLASVLINGWMFLKWEAIDSHARASTHVAADRLAPHTNTEAAALAIAAGVPGICHVERLELRKKRARVWVVTHAPEPTEAALASSFLAALQSRVPGIERVRVHIRREDEGAAANSNIVPTRPGA